MSGEVQCLMTFVTYVAKAITPAGRARRRYPSATPLPVRYSKASLAASPSKTRSAGSLPSSACQKRVAGLHCVADDRTAHNCSSYYTPETHWSRVGAVDRPASCVSKELGEVLIRSGPGCRVYLIRNPAQIAKFFVLRQQCDLGIPTY